MRRFYPNYQQRLGSGTYGSVYRTNNDRYAYKQFNEDIVDYDTCIVADSIREITIIKALSSVPHVVRIHEVELGDEERGFIMDYHPYTLLTVPRENINNDLIRRWIFELLLALFHVHNKLIIHGDLKPANILVDEEYHIVIADWGLAGFLDYLSNDKFMLIQSQPYRAPEVLQAQLNRRNQKYTTKVDIWSVGLMCYDIINEEPLLIPSAGESSEHQQLTDIDELFTDPDNFPLTGLEIDELLRHMLAINPEERYSAAQCLNHPYFDDEVIARFGSRQYFTDLSPKAQIKTLEYVLRPSNKLTKTLVQDAAEWLKLVTEKLHSDHTVFFTSLSYYCRYVNLSKVEDHLLCLIACLYLAITFVEARTIPVEDFAFNFNLDPEVICSMMRKICQRLDYDLYHSTPISYLNIFDDNNYSVKYREACVTLLISVMHNRSALSHSIEDLTIHAMNLIYSTADVIQVADVAAGRLVLKTYGELRGIL